MPNASRWLASVICLLAASLAWQPAPAKSPPASAGGRVASRGAIHLTYLGNAGWRIDDGKTVILVDPFLTEFTARNGGKPPEGDDPIIEPDPAVIDPHVDRADYILVTHGHVDHMLDAPYISKKTGASIILSPGSANIARAYDVANDKLIIVKGGEDYAFPGFSVRVIPSLHSPLFTKHYNGMPIAGVTPPGLRAPLHVSAYVENGTFAYLLRMNGHQILIMGGMNFIEREMQGLRPDIALIGANASHHESFDYAGRIMRALGHPPVVFPTHWDAFGHGDTEKAQQEVKGFAAEIRAASPRTRVIVPAYFTPMTFR